MVSNFFPNIVLLLDVKNMVETCHRWHAFRITKARIQTHS